jgi:hypothetical protein
MRRKSDDHRNRTMQPSAFLPCVHREAEITFEGHQVPRVQGSSMETLRIAILAINGVDHLD